MQELRIVGVEAEGKTPQLLLSDEAGAEYALPIDQALKSAVTSRVPPAGHRSAERQSATFAPREIQARLRAGATVDQVVAASGLSEEHVLRYAGPVADERAFYASRARRTTVARASTAENHRMAFGDAPASLEDMVRVRLRAVGVQLDSLAWDAWRRDDGLWAVTADFDAASSESHAGAIGQPPPAEWVYDPAARSVRPVNKWADSLMSLPQGPVRHRSGRRLAAVEEPFDVDEDATPSAARTALSPPPAAAETPKADTEGHEDLLEILRARRGQRLGADESGDDKLATLLTRDDPAGEERPAGLRPVESTDEGSAVEASDAEGESAADSSGKDAWGFSYEDSQDDDNEGHPSPRQPDDPPAQGGDAQPRKRSASRRPTMPRWDDILFGSKNE